MGGISWGEWIKTWTEQVYEPFFAPEGIEKGTALLSTQITLLSDAINRLPSEQAKALKDVTLRVEEGDDPWKGPQP